MKLTLLTVLALALLLIFVPGDVLAIAVLWASFYSLVGGLVFLAVLWFGRYRR